MSSAEHTEKNVQKSNLFVTVNAVCEQTFRMLSIRKTLFCIHIFTADQPLLVLISTVIPVLFKFISLVHYLESQTPVDLV